MLDYEWEAAPLSFQHVDVDMMQRWIGLTSRSPPVPAAVITEGMDLSTLNLTTFHRRQYPPR